MELTMFKTPQCSIDSNAEEKLLSIFSFLENPKYVADRSNHFDQIDTNKIPQTKISELEQVQTEINQTENENQKLGLAQKMADIFDEIYWHQQREVKILENSDNPNLCEQIKRPDYNPESFGQVLDSVISDLDSGVSLLATPINSSTRIGSRPANARSVSFDQLSGDFRNLYTKSFYNSPTIRGSEYPRAINSPEMEGIKEEVREYLREANLRVVIPFVDESTVLVDARYASSLVGEGKVLTPNAVLEGKEGLVESRQASIEKQGAKYLDQRAMLSSIDWEQLGRIGVLPVDSFNFDTGRLENGIGTKGATLLAAYLDLLKQEQNGEINDDTIILLHDSDIINPADYGAIEMLGIAMKDNQERFNNIADAFMIAKSGVGRNNQLTNLFHDQFAMQSNNPQIRKLALGLSSILWPHTGERAMKWGQIKQMPIPLGMAVEHIFNIHAMSKSILTGNQNLLQVLNPVPKKECGISDSTREWNEMSVLAQHMQKVLSWMDANNLSSLSDLNPLQIAQLNDFTREKLSIVTIADESTQRPKQAYVSQQGLLLPSLNQMLANKVIQTKNSKQPKNVNQVKVSQYSLK